MTRSAPILTVSLVVIAALVACNGKREPELALAPTTDLPTGELAAKPSDSDEREEVVTDIVVAQTIATASTRGDSAAETGSAPVRDASAASYAPAPKAQRSQDSDRTERKKEDASGAMAADDLAYDGSPPMTGGALARALVDGVDLPAPPPVVTAPRPTELPDPVANTESYTDYGVNGFVLTERDRFSTFAADVDTASYAISRSKLQQGYLPVEAAVRVEEFVNNFDYEYKQPSAGSPFSVDFEASPSPWNPRNHIVRVGVQGRDVTRAQRKSVHLTFLVDTSGSMQATEKIGLVKKTLTMLTKELQDGDTVAIATYAGSTQILLEPTSMGQRDRILRSLDGLSAGGSTAMGAGIDLAYRLADKSYVDGAVNRVIICSDGDANVGQTSHTVLTEQIKGYAAKGVTLTTVGFGSGNYKDTMMERLANEGDGNYYYIDSEREARHIFVDKLDSAMEVIAKDVKIQVEWNPEDVVAYRLIGYENRDVADRDFRNDAVDAGEIGAGHQVTALYEVALADGASGAIGTVRVRNKAPGPEAPAVERSFSLDRSTFRGSVAETSRQFRIAVASATFAEILRGSPHVGEVSLEQVRQLAQGAARAEYPADAELVSLIATADRLKGGATYSRR